MLCFTCFFCLLSAIFSDIKMKLSVLIAAGLASLASALPLLDNTAETLVSNDTTGLDFFELGGGNFTQAESVEWKHCRAW